MSGDVHVRFCERPGVRFPRATHPVVHCVSKRQAEKVLAALQDRMAEVGLQLHPDKTKIVYCRDSSRREDFEHTSFTFLGFTFQPREARRADGSRFTSFLPAISKVALKKISQQVRSWRLHLRTGHSAFGLARIINPVVRGWMTYYGAFYRSALYPVLNRVNTYLLRWFMKKYAQRATWKQAIQAMREVHQLDPTYFAHWAWAKPVNR